MRRMRIPWNTPAIYVVLAVVSIQIPFVSAKCYRTNMDDCCEANLTCPVGYYEVQNCPTTPSMTSLTTTLMTTQQSGTTNNSGNTNSTVGSTSESPAVGSTTRPSPGSSPTSSADDADASDNSTTTSTESVTSVHPTTISNGVVCRRCPGGCDECTASGNCTKTPLTPFPVVAVAAGVSGGMVFVIVVVVVIICIVKRRRREDCENPASVMDEVLNGRRDSKPTDDNDNAEPSNLTEPEYANIPTRPENMSVNIMQGQDKIFRYVKDPTDHTTEKEENPVYENQMSINVKKGEDENKEIAALGEAPAPPEPPAAPPEETDPDTIQPRPVVEAPRSVRHSTKTGNRAEPATAINEDDNDEEQIYENEATLMGGGSNSIDNSTYVNYAFHKDN